MLLRVKKQIGDFITDLLKNNFEISYVGKWGTGQTVYQGTNRYGIENFTMSQHKLEVKDDNFFR